MNEYPGVSYATGVDANFAANPTFANILRQFNPRYTLLEGDNKETDHFSISISSSLLIVKLTGFKN